MAENRIVLLSTHIIEDVAVLCPAFAVIRQGEILARTTPTEAREAIDGAVYEGEKAGLDQEEIHHTRTVIQSLLVEGRRGLRIYQPDGDPPSGFRSVQPTLEDAYFVIMKAGGVPVPASRDAS